MRFIIYGLILLSLTLLHTASGSEQLTTTIIGSGSPTFNKERASACVLISSGNTRILVDMGNGTQANLQNLGVDLRTFSALLFTHHHLDHNEEFAPLFIRSLMGRHNFTIIGPPKTIEFAEVTLQLYAEDIAYRLGKTQRTFTDRKDAFSLRDIQGGESFDIGNIHVSTIQVPHTIHTVAYRFDYKGESIVITGDLTYTESLSIFAKNADFMIIDSGGMIIRNGQERRRAMKGDRNSSDKSKERRRASRERAHVNLHESSLMAKQANVKNMVYTHFKPGEVDQEASLEEIRKNYSGEVIFGEDLMVLSNTLKKPALDSPTTPGAYPIVDTGQLMFYSNDDEIQQPAPGDDFYGQDANYAINEPSYTNNNDGTITDNVTNLMWQKAMTEKIPFTEAFKQAETCELGGHNDWRVPSIKELYSLINFTGRAQGQRVIKPFIDTEYFDQPLGDTSSGERQIDAQTWSSTEYVGNTMRNNETVFGVNFVDGRIKGYSMNNPRTQKPNTMYFRFVRGNTTYGINHFTDNRNGTVTDSATGLMWQQSDSKKGMNWQDALKYANRLNLAGHDDWRLPNAKELQGIVDYTQSVQTSGLAAIDPIFATTEIKDPADSKQYPYFWTSTTHLDGSNPYNSAVYIAFGSAQGKMRDKLMDVHGAGSQRSDPKSGDALDYPQFFGPQGDVRYVFNYVRCVRTVKPANVSK